MHDRIEINGLTVTTVVGALPHEREIAQPLRFDLVARRRPARRRAQRRARRHRALRRGHRAGRRRRPREQGRPARAPRRPDGRGRRRLRPCRGRRADRDQAAPADRRARRHDGRAHPPHARPTSTLAPRSSHRAIVALGSNLGDREQLPRTAPSTSSVTSSPQSQVFETDPVGGPDGQGAYLNMVVAVDTPLDPFAFVRRCQRIEAEALRQRTVHWGPRTLDVDVLFYDDVDDRLAGADHPAPPSRRAPLRARPARRGGARALPARLGATPLPAGGRASTRPAAADSRGRPAARTRAPWRDSGPGRTRGAGARRSRAARRAGPSPSTAGRCTAAARSGAARRGWCTPASGTRSAPPTATPAGRTRCPGRRCSGGAAP